ncbi:hypothetical protein Pla175_16890 [Pirellulimonas nuda]|uniref:Uncharacterized protein n=1 Tax=Pirellulimonas nuda TaxID=2528009 RepID=A0A518D9Z9_9BACT|nr:hypothetical protein [Pirellulimonas nuda]QDU88314.1 hypothetical protein Pla175_16890 [Pirellulimonas nuda]
MTPTTLEPTPIPTPTQPGFLDRRESPVGDNPGRERRQFVNSYHELSPEAAELARGVDAYKARNRRRFIGYDELLEVVRSLGYQR